MNCPVCERETMAQWETTGPLKSSDPGRFDGTGFIPRWFAGEYECVCGRYTASGVVHVDGRAVHAWHPCCPDHGCQTVLRTDGDRFRCSTPGCGRVWELRDGRILRTRTTTFRAPEHLELYRASRKVMGADCPQ